MKDPEKKRRNKVKHPALIPKYNPKIRQAEIDYDYLDQLSPDELDYLNQFTEEFINARFNNDGTDIDNTPEGRKASYDRNNARNRCLYGQIKSRHWVDNKLVNYDDVINKIEENPALAPTYMESAYVEFLDKKQIEDMITEYEVAMTSFNEADE